LPHAKTIAMFGNERISHFASRAKYALALFKMSRSSVTQASSHFIALQLTNLGILPGIARHLPRQLPLPRIHRMLTHAEPLRHLRYRITALGDLGHRITLELVAKIGLPRGRLLSSKSGLKASRNPGATQACRRAAPAWPAQWHRSSSLCGARLGSPGRMRKCPWLSAPIRGKRASSTQWALGPGTP